MEQAGSEEKVARVWLARVRRSTLRRVGALERTAASSVLTRSVAAVAQSEAVKVPSVMTACANPNVVNQPA